MIGEELPTLGNRSLKEEEDAFPFTVLRSVLPEVSHHFAAKDTTKMAEKHQEGAVPGKITLEGVGAQVDAVDGGLQQGSRYLVAWPRTLIGQFPDSLDDLAH